MVPRRAIALLLFVSILVAGCATPGSERGDPPATPVARGALVVSSNADAAEAGASILRAGGNAIDAAAAVAFALTVTEPHLSGIGGGAFILYRAPEGGAWILDGRESAPAASTSDQFLLVTGQPQPYDHAVTRGYAVGIPGAVRAWADVVARNGSLPLADVLAPAIRLAEEGAPVTASLARAIMGEEAKLRSWPPSARVFFPGAVCVELLPDPISAEAPCVGGVGLAEGDLLVRPDLAAMFRLLAERGPDAFYTGEVAQAIVNAVATRDGRMTLEDLSGYRAVDRAPLTLRIGEFDMLSMPPPGGGVIVLQMLALLEPFQLRDAGFNTAADLHHFVEAAHLSYADRGAYLGDPAFVHVPVAGLLDPAYLDERRALIDPDFANTDVRPGTPPGASGVRWQRPSLAPHERASHTSHLIVVDKAGAIVTSTATIESIFGNGMIVDGWGFMLNNEMTDFDFEPGGPNEVAPGKRPRSAMSPTIAIKDGAAILTIGAAGGPTIITTIAKVTFAILEHELGVEEAVAAPRVYSPSFNDLPFNIEHELGLPPETLVGLRTRGHNPGPPPFPSGPNVANIGQLQAAHVEEGRWVGGSRTPGGVVYVD